MIVETTSQQRLERCEEERNLAKEEVAELEAEAFVLSCEVQAQAEELEGGES